MNDRMLLFLEPVDPGFAEFVGGALTHQHVKLDGVGYLRGERVVDGEHNGGAGELLQTMTLDEVRELLRHS